MGASAGELSQSIRTVQGVSRLIGVALVLFSLYQWSHQIERHVYYTMRYDIPFTNVFEFIWDATYWTPYLTLISGLLLAFRSAWVARLCVPITLNAHCPKCRFSLEGSRADRCPECGLYLGEDFHAPPPPSQSESSSE
jgi:hypothetical protein